MTVDALAVERHIRTTFGLIAENYYWLLLDACRQTCGAIRDSFMRGEKLVCVLIRLA